VRCAICEQEYVIKVGSNVLLLRQNTTRGYYIKTLYKTTTLKQYTKTLHEKHKIRELRSFPLLYLRCAARIIGLDMKR